MPDRRDAAAVRPGASGQAARVGRRGQLAVSVLEGVVAVTLVLAVSVGFVTDLPQPDQRRAQLDAYAEDVTTLLTEAPPRHEERTRLDEVIATREAFRRERSTLDRRLERVLPENVFVRVHTPHGAVGYRKPAGVVTGTASVTTAGGEVRVEVWYG